MADAALGPLTAKAYNDWLARVGDQAALQAIHDMRADFYRLVYPSTDGVGGYLTGDYRMAALSSHLFGVAVNLDFGVLAAESATLRRLRARMSYDRYFNSNNYSANILESGVDFRF